MSIGKLTEEINVNQSFKCSKCKDRNWLKQCECGHCDKIIFEKDKRGIPRKISSGHNLFLHNGKAEKHSCWKGGRTKQNKYWSLTIPDYFSSDSNNRVKEHVYFYQEYYKCCMLYWGDVHHIDGNKENNMIWNLQGMMKGQHSRLHMIGNKYGRYKKKNKIT